jgi:hypothetical protein
MNNTLKTMLVAAAALTAVASQAQDKATLDLLVKKGVISAEERAKTLQSSAATKTESGMDRVFTKEAGANRLTFSGRIQGQWEAAAYTQTTAGVETQAADLNNVMMRRLYLGAKADVGAGFSGELVWNFGDNSNASSTTTTTTTTTTGPRRVATVPPRPRPRAPLPPSVPARLTRPLSLTKAPSVSST